MKQNRHAPSVNVFEAAKQRIPIKFALSFYGLDMRRGDYCLCPFHQEHDPSMKIYTKNNTYFCYGCGAGGTVIDFVVRMFGLDSLDAVRKLDADFHLNLFGGKSLTPTEIDKAKRETERRKQEKRIMAGFKSMCDDEYYSLSDAYKRYRDEVKDLEPQDHTEIPPPQFFEALDKRNRAEISMDVLDSGTQQQKIEYFRAKKAGGANA